jgi:hypothetical protein
MLSSEEIKDILYSTIQTIGNNRIRCDITSNIDLSGKYIDLIMADCVTKINLEPNVSDKDETSAILCEALLHFMLTVCSLPSERKIQVKDNLSIDVVVPNMTSLNRTPDKSIIIEFMRNKADLNRIAELELLQPNYNNIWLISVIPFSTRCRTYGLSRETQLYDNTFPNIITDINNFLKETGNKSLRLIH